MNKLSVTTIAFLIILSSSDTLSQEIDPSMLKNLSPTQLEMVKTS